MDTNRLNISKNGIIIIVFASLPFCHSPAQDMLSITNDMNSSEKVVVNNKKLQKQAIGKLAGLLKDLKESEKEIYTKPDYVITYTKNGALQFISIFKDEHFVYIGDYLDAWGTRMHGKASFGYKLDKKLLKYLCLLE